MRKLLVVVDYQNDFVSGTLGFDGADLIEDNIIDLIKDFDQEGYDVVFTKDTHYEDYLNTAEGHNLPIIHCQKDTKGWGFAGKLEDYIGNHIVFEKEQFGSDLLGEFIRENDYDEIYLCGLVSDICVFSNAIIAKSFANPKTEVFVIRDASGSNDINMQEKSFDVLEHLHIHII